MSEVQLIPNDDDDGNAREMLEVYRRAHKAEENVRQFLAHWSNEQAAIIDLCRPILGDRAVDGDGNIHNALSLADLVKAAIEKLSKAPKPSLLLERLDELRPQMDGPGWLARDAERDIITFFLRDAENIQPATEVKP